MKLNFNLNPNGNNLAIFAVVRHKGKLLRKYTGHAIPGTKKGDKAVHWDYDKQRAKDFPDALMINRKLSDWQRIFDEYAHHCTQDEIEPVPQTVLDMWSSKKVLPGMVRSLTEGFELFMQAKRITHDTSTITRYKVMLDQILKYQKDKSIHIELDQVNEEFFLDYSKWLAESQGNVNKTIKRKLNMVRTICNYAVKKGILKSMDFRQEIDLKDIDTNRVPLNDRERAAFLSYQTTDLQERCIVDAFITSMYTGLRFSDLQQLATLHINSFETESGPQYFLNMAAQKTLSRGSIPLPEHIYNRLKPYLGASKEMFKIPYNSLANSILKSVAKKLGLNRQIESKAVRLSRRITATKLLYNAISFHFARYTYTTIQETAEIIPTYIQKNMGHNKFATTEGYLQSDHMKRIRETNDKLRVAK
jgi:site-specific recombinase XerC